MKITDIELYASDTIGSLAFSLTEVKPDDKYYIKNILGLDADELIPKFYASGLVTKPKFYDFSMKPRLIVMSLILNPRFKLDETISDLRDTIYRMLSSSRTGKIDIYLNSSGATVAKTAGFITKFEATYFTDKPEVQISIQCDDPLFRGINSIAYTTTLDQTNPIVIEDPLSTAPHGFALTVTFSGAWPSFTIQEKAANPEWVFSVWPAGGFISGDVVYLSSEKSNKYLYYVRAGVSYYVMDKITPTSIWPLMFPGLNSFHIPEEASLTLNKAEFYPAYWGV